MPTQHNNEIYLSDIIAPSFYDLHLEVVDSDYTYFRLSGGRGSTKSSFISLEIILGMMTDAENGKHTNAIVFRRYENKLRTSVFKQLIWAINKLGAGHLWKGTVSPLRLTFIPTGQTISFVGADDENKVKSITESQGYFKYLWFEELAQFEGPEKIRSIKQSIIRGGDKFTVFFSYNPPKTRQSWVNDPAEWNRPDTLTHKSTYLDVPPDWLGKDFIIDAEHLKSVKPEAYEHEYLGEITGTGGEVFGNVELKTISDAEIAEFTVKRRGLDEGYAIDPLAYVGVAYERKFRRLYIFEEVYALAMSNRKAIDAISAKNKLNDPVYCDSAAARFISELQQCGMRISAVKKIADSVEYGIKFLQDLEQIIIDPNRCPNAAREFLGYELERDANGNYKAAYPDKNNHTIDAVRYALNAECLNHKEPSSQKLQPNYNFPSEKPKPHPFNAIVTEDFFKFDC